MNARMCHKVQVVGFLVGIIAGAAWGDCGSIPFRPPRIPNPIEITQPLRTPSTEPAREARTVDFDPLKVVVFEPQQRAVILWNGQEEILLLSTDQRASEKSGVLEVIPLPAEPRVRLGSFQTLEAAQRLVIHKRVWACAHGGARAGVASLPESAGRITFQARLGAHDLTVAEVRNPAGLVGFVQNFLQERYQTPNAPIRPDFVRIIRSYLDEGFRWFAFDVLLLDSTIKSRDPIEYRFQSDAVFYPLRISSLEAGKTKVDHIVFTPKEFTEFRGPAKDLRREPLLSATREEVEALDPDWRGFFGQSTSLVLHQWKIEGESAKLLVDVRAK